MGNEQITISSWNLLTTYDGNAANTTHQTERIPAIVSSLQAIQPDVSGVYEVMNENTESLARDLQHLYSTTTPYCDSKYDMAIQLTSKIEPSVTAVIDYPMDQRKAIAATIAGIMVIATHLSFSIPRFDWRVKQVRQLLEASKDEDRAVIMADFNCMPWQKPRKMLEAAGFTSVAKNMQPANPVTFPSPLYKPKLSFLHRLVSHRGLSIDDIYVKGLEIVDSGLIEGDSDHFGVWATVK